MRSALQGFRVIAFAVTALAAVPAAHAEEGGAAPAPADLHRDSAVAAEPSIDPRIRLVPYDSGRVFSLLGYVGYQIDLQFEPGETFVGLAAGDIDALSFVAQDNHLFLKPKAPRVGTNLTVLTNRRQYQFDYAASSHRPDPDTDEVIYAVRFTYPPPPHDPHADEPAKTAAALARAAEVPPRNIDYWYCGNPALKPSAASDDGLHTRIRFPGNAELPALFVRNEDGTESLLNFSFDEGDVIVHRVAHRFILRRGKLTGCIVNQGFQGSAERRASNTISPDVSRETKRSPTRPATGDVP